MARTLSVQRLEASIDLNAAPRFTSTTEPATLLLTWIYDAPDNIEHVPDPFTGDSSYDNHLWLYVGANEYVRLPPGSQARWGWRPDPTLSIPSSGLFKVAAHTAQISRILEPLRAATGAAFSGAGPAYTFQGVPMRGAELEPYETDPTCEIQVDGGLLVEAGWVTQAWFVPHYSATCSIQGAGYAERIFYSQLDTAPPVTAPPSDETTIQPGSPDGP